MKKMIQLTAILIIGLISIQPTIATYVPELITTDPVPSEAPEINDEKPSEPEGPNLPIETNVSKSTSSGGIRYHEPNWVNYSCMRFERRLGNHTVFVKSSFASNTCFMRQVKANTDPFVHFDLVEARNAYHADMCKGKTACWTRFT
jgi:hypothetical protein